MASLDDFIKPMKEIEYISKLIQARGKDSRADERDKADNEIRKIAYDTLKDVGVPGIDYSRASPDSISKDHVEQGIELKVGMAQQDSARMLKDNTEDILNSIKQDSLEEIALTEPIAKKGNSRGYEEVLNLYQEYLGTKQLVDRYKKGQIQDPRELQAIKSGGAKKAEKEMREKLKNKNYSKDLQDMASSIAALAARDDYINPKYIEEGADELTKEAEKKFRDYEKDKGKKIIDYVKENLKNFFKGDTEEFETAKSLVYQAAKK